MKPIIYFVNRIFLLLAFSMLTSISFQSFAQCSSSLKSISYNTVLKGTGNNSWGFLLPQFNPLQGTLIAVNISATISVRYAFTLENNTNSAVGYNVNVERHDSINSSSLSSPINNLIFKNYGPYNLNPTDGTNGSGLDYTNQGPINLLSNYVLDDSIVSNVVLFLGTGNAMFAYNPATTATVSGSTNYNFNATANDTIHFLLTYYYCNAVVLQTTITDFFASKQNDETIKLSWTTQNELSGRIYGIQKSDDGINFSEVNNISSVDENTSVNYSSNYSISANDKNRIYFKLKIIDKNGDINYSEIRTVELDKSDQRISVYPNPSNSFVNIVFSNSIGNLQTDIFAANGELIQRNYFVNTNSAHINFKNKLACGVYFIKVFDMRSQKNYVVSFVVK
jgi:hypothetical protein